MSCDCGMRSDGFSFSILGYIELCASVLRLFAGVWEYTGIWRFCVVLRSFEDINVLSDY